MSPASPTLAARAGRAHSRSLEPGSRVADPRGSSIPTSVDSIPTSVDSTPTTVDSTPTTVDSTPTTVDSSQTSGESTHPHASRFGRLHGSFEASSHVASTSTKHRHEREHRLHEHRRKRRRARIQCDVVVGWKSAACVSLQPLVAASRLALPVAYVGISKRMRGRYAGLPETLDTLPWGGIVPLQSVRHLHARPITRRSAGWCARRFKPAVLNPINTLNGG